MLTQLMVALAAAYYLIATDGGQMAAEAVRGVVATTAAARPRCDCRQLMLLADAAGKHEAAAFLREWCPKLAAA